MSKAISLLSGGLDSILALKIVQEQQVDIVAINFSTPFTGKSEKSYKISKRLSDALGIHLEHIKISGRKYLDLIRKPRFGYGANLNPCIDCHIFMLKKAAEYMREEKASFLITGEVLGQRPMSQNKRALKLIEKENGMEGLILRPLSAKLLEPTISEKRGWVDREKLLDIHGRSRRRQIGLADKFGIKNYLTPAGGCLLTDPGFSRRLKDLKKYKVDFTIDDIEFLKTGRHFRFTPETKLIVGRDEIENNKLRNLAKEDNLIFYPSEIKGPVAIGRGKFNNSLMLLASGIISRYSDSKPNEEVEIINKTVSDKIKESFKVLPLADEKVKDYMV